MENFVQFPVDDTSPSISYSPFSDTFTSPDLSAGWNPYYDLSGFIHSVGEVGNGTSLHITSHDGASLALQWRGTGIQLRGNVTLASYSLTVDGESVPSPVPTDNILANIEGLEDAIHNITLTANITQGQNPPNSSMLVFDEAIILSSPIPVSSNVSFRSQTLSDSDIAFLGQWTFQTAPSGSSFHTSSHAGDRAVMSFNGTAFLMQGITSPEAGNYTVTLDNVTSSILSGRSSFTAYDSLLFFASGLDPNATHSVEVRNLGGELSLLVDGVNTFIPYNPPTTTPSSIPSPAGTTSTMSFEEGTIAAFILAGILGFAILTGSLFYFLFYRPRRQRQRRIANDRLGQSPKEQEAGMVLDIVPNDEGHYTKDFDLEEEISPLEDRPHSGGFARWRREAMHGSMGGISLPLHFRHSDSADGKSRYYNGEQPASATSDPRSSDSSGKRRARAKRKGKARQITGRSWSPSYTLDLPMQQARPSSVQNNSTRITSMGGMSSFIAAEPSPQKPRNPDPPSYAASVSNRDSIRNSNSDPSSGIPSGPRSVSHSPVNASYPRAHYRENSLGFLLHEGEPNSDQDSPSADHPPHQLSHPDAIPMRPLTRYDGGSLTTEDDPSIIEPSSMREVLRSLSPRTSEATHQRQTQRHQTVVESTDPVPPTEFPTHMVLDDDETPYDQSSSLGRSKSLPRTPSSDDDELVEVRNGVFLSVRETSPFRVDFDSRSTRIPTASDESTDAPYLTALSGSRKPSRKSSGASNLPGRFSAPPRMPEFVQGASRLPFRLTPMALVTPQSPPKLSSSGHSDGVTSFLDLTNSREGSMRSHSIRTGTAGSDQDKPIDENRLSVPVLVEPKSRWSNTTVPSVATNPAPPANESSGESQIVSPSDARSTTDSSTFPIQVQVTIPPSPHHVMDTDVRRRSRASGVTQSGDLHVHPALENLESPTDSIPMSVSDLHFRHSDSEDISSSRRTTELSTSHPPLPGSPGGEEFRPRPFDPSILVSRVLGIPSSGSPSTSTARPGGHSRSASAATPSYNSFPSLRPGPNQSNDHLNPSDTSGQAFS